MYTSGIHVAARFITLHQFWTLVGMNPLWWIVLWKNDFVWNIFCGAADICQHHKKKKKAYARMRSEISFYICNPQRSHMEPSCHQRVTGQEKCYPTGPKLIARFSEASEHHFLCFLPGKCKEQYGIFLKVRFWGSLSVGRPERTCLHFECEWKSTVECPGSESVTFHASGSA